MLLPHLGGELVRRGIEDEQRLQVGEQVSHEGLGLAVDHGRPLGHLLHSEEPLSNRGFGVHVAGMAKLVGDGGKDGGRELVLAQCPPDGLDLFLYGDNLEIKTHVFTLGVDSSNA